MPATWVPPVVLIWERPEDVALAHVVGRELGLPVVRAYDADGLVGHGPGIEPGSRLLLVADAIRDGYVVRAAHALAGQLRGRLVGTAVLIDTPALARSPPTRAPWWPCCACHPATEATSGHHEAWPVRAAGVLPRPAGDDQDGRGRRRDGPPGGRCPGGDAGRRGGHRGEDRPHRPHRWRARRRRLPAGVHTRGARGPRAGREAGCATWASTCAPTRIGNTIATYAGAGSGPAVGVGSHLDSVYHGGRFDGIVGVVGAVELVRLLVADGTRLEHPLRVVIFAGEEGARFGEPCIGSKAVAGDLTSRDLSRIRDAEGVSLAAAMRLVGLDPTAVADATWRSADWAAFLELHIEQARTLEVEGTPIGLVDMVSGSTRLRLVLAGRADHSGGTPMAMREDALVDGVGDRADGRGARHGRRTTGARD